MGRKKTDVFDVLLGPTPAEPLLGASAVAEILGIKPELFQKFFKSRRLDISPSGQLGKGPGSRRYFTRRDIHRIGAAAFLLRDGFDPRVVSAVLQDIKDDDFLRYDVEGKEAGGGVSFIRGAKGPKLGSFRSGNPPEIRPEGPVYYALDLGEIAREINRRIDATVEKKKGR